MAGGEAQLKYLDGDFDVVMPGAYVTCAVTGKQIALEDLRYWSVARQEAYVDADASMQAELDNAARSQSSFFYCLSCLLPRQQSIYRAISSRLKAGNSPKAAW